LSKIYKRITLQESFEEFDTFLAHDTYKDDKFWKVFGWIRKPIALVVVGIVIWLLRAYVGSVALLGLAAAYIGIQLKGKGFAFISFIFLIPTDTILEFFDLILGFVYKDKSDNLTIHFLNNYKHLSLRLVLLFIGIYIGKMTFFPTWHKDDVCISKVESFREKGSEVVSGSCRGGYGMLSNVLYKILQWLFPTWFGEHQNKKNQNEPKRFVFEALSLFWQV
jgi:hypothetical protein